MRGGAARARAAANLTRPGAAHRLGREAIRASHQIWAVWEVSLPGLPNFGGWHLCSHARLHGSGGYTR
jgi:hypothetical protein